VLAGLLSVFVAIDLFQVEPGYQDIRDGAALQDANIEIRRVSKTEPGEQAQAR
jgi:hypothetical protein